MYYFIKLMSRLVCLLPAGVRNFIGDFLGAAVWPLVPKKRREMAIANVMAALKLDRPAATAVVRRSVIRLGRMLMEMLYLPKLTRENIGRLVAIKGREHFTAALAYGRGAVLATAHTGNWELLGPALVLYGFPVVGVAQRQTNAAMDEIINEFRTTTGMHITYKTGVREMVSLLGRGMIVGLIMDQDAKQQGIFAEFFGRPASTPQGPAALARLKDAPIVPTFITANDNDTHTIIVHPPLWVEKTDDRDRDFFAATQKLNAMIEDHIRAHPTEWFWLHNRWKTPPPGR